jgi:hypothetical protein
LTLSRIAVSVHCVDEHAPSVLPDGRRRLLFDEGC